MTTITRPKAAIFPRNEVEATLRGELMHVIETEATLSGTTLPADPAEAVKATISIDSLVAVTILCSIEPIIGFELPQKIVRTGGYSSIEEALNHLLPEIEQTWMKKKGAAR